MKKSREISHDALALIQAAGSKATTARISVLNVLLSSEYTLTHAEIEQALDDNDDAIERVTLYRVLDWLVSSHLAHKVVGSDRVWRFNAQKDPMPSHAHFNCHECGKVFCLENLNPVFKVNLPQGYQLDNVDVSLQGLCPRCSH